jgi:hypothetical protein
MDPDRLNDLADRVQADETIPPGERIAIALPVFDRIYVRPESRHELSVGRVDESRRNWHAVPVEERRLAMEIYESAPVLEGGDDAREESTVLDSELDMHKRMQEGDG